MWLKRIQLGLIHTGVAIALVPFTSILNRVMIAEMGIAATIVGMLVVLPYLFSPIQIAIGSFADQHPILGMRRTPYIAVGLVACVSGLFFAPVLVGLLETVGWTALTIILAVITFGAWGMGYNFAAVSYLSLASEIDEQHRSRTVAVMFFIMIIGIIFTAISLGIMVENYTLPALRSAFWAVGIAALVLGVLGLIRLEPRFETEKTERRYSFTEVYAEIIGNSQARLFFIYLIILLVAILAQDLLLEPFGAQVLDMSTGTTSRFTSVWGVCTLITLIAAGFLQRKLGKKGVARIGAWIALLGFVAIAVSGITHSTALFYTGLAAHGFGTGFATVSNLSLMLDMTTPQNVGLFMGAWGIANALSRLIGPLMSGIVRDICVAIAGNQATGYILVFGLEALFLFISLLMLRHIDVDAFQKGTGTKETTLIERAALMGEAGTD